METKKTWIAPEVLEIEINNGADGAGDATGKQVVES